jgi:hypothetical protein
MTPEAADRLFAGVMAASPMVALGVALFLAAVFWPVGRGR